MSTLRTRTSLAAALALALLCAPAPAAAAPRPDAGDDAYRVLAGLCERGLHELAVEEGERFLREHTGHPRADEARYRLASALFELERLDAAAPHFRALAGRAGFELRAESALRLGECELAAGRPRRAAEAFEQALRDGGPALALPATFLRAEALLQAGEHEAARGLYRRALQLDEQGEYAAHTLRGLAWCAFRAGDTTRCLERARELLHEHEGHELAGEMRFLVGECELASEHPERALAAYEQVPAGPHRAAALRGSAFAHAALGDHAAAARAFGALLAAEPQGRFAAEAALQQGVHLVLGGDAEGALAPLRSPAAGDGPEARYWRARALAGTGAKEPALRELERALRDEPQGELAARLQAARGDLLFELGRLDDSAAAYESAGSDYALHAGAVAHLNAGRNEQAAQLARKLLADHPDSAYRARTRLALGEALFAQERWSDALQAFEAVAGDGAEDADRAHAAARAAWCAYMAGAHADAAERFARVVRAHPDAPEVAEARYMEARAREEAGQDARAATGYRAYLERHPDGAKRDEALLRLARFEDGTASLERLLALAPDGPLAHRALYELAAKLEAAGDLDGAVERRAELLRRFPRSEHAPAARYALAWCLHELGRSDEADRALAELLRDCDDAELRAAASELRVWTGCAAGRLASALEGWKELRERCDDERRLLAATRTLARALAAAGRAEDAQAVLLVQQDGARDRGVARELLVEGAWIALDAGALDGAEERVRAAARLDADDAGVAEAAFHLGEARFAAGELARATELYALAAQAAASPVAPEALYKRGFAFLRREDPRAAAACFAALVDGHRDSELWGEGLFLLGEARFRAGDFEGCAAALERLVAEQPRHEVLPKALFRLGLALVELQRWKRADEVLSTLARKHADFPNLAEAELARGRALAAGGDRRGARAAYERVLAADEGVLAARARLGLGHLAVDAEELDDALSQFLKVALLYAHAEEVSEALYMAGRCLEAQGQPELALRQYEELLRDHPDTAHAAPARERVAALR